MRILLSSIAAFIREWINPLPLAGVMLTLFFGWLIIFGDQGILTWRELSQKKTELEQDTKTLSKEVMDMEEEIKRLKDPYYLEPIVRDELGYVRPGELIFQFPNEEKSK